MDGVLDLTSIAQDRGPEYQYPIFEFKTTGVKFIGLNDLDIEAYRKKWPEYYAQNQEYMRLSGRRLVIVLIFGMGYPWEMREVHVPWDPQFALGIRDKYLRVRQQVADQAPSRDCCGTPKSCPARGVCEIARWVQ